MASDLLARRIAGMLRGRRNGRIAVFRGIPYALPLRGPRRFQAPVTVPAWDGIRDTIRFGPAAPQLSSPTDSDLWSPDPGVVGLPVMVWIHGDVT
ncbi:hypothetical protein B1987_01210 [Mycobacterium kansasii]|uniref:carboxylesterase family protein n=1 Tax=Mycobacterium attenuatum TaxID=2341086 RepID=UPI000A0C68A2|nr:hypothetical protein B1987_01210 [Mycobacterium kansasii]